MTVLFVLYIAALFGAKYTLPFRIDLVLGDGGQPVVPPSAVETSQ